MQQKKSLCIYTHSLKSGGAERSTAMLSEILDELGYQVHIITVVSGKDFNYSGKLLDLGKYDGIKNPFQRKFQKLNLARNYFKKHNFDLIIDASPRPSVLKTIINKLFLYKYTKTIYMVRSALVSKYIPNNKWVIDKVYKKAKAIVCVSSGIADKLKIKYNFTNIKVIYNPVDIEFVEKASVEKTIDVPEYSYWLAYGRIDEKVKNYTLLIESYQQSEAILKGIKLLILGTGKDLTYLKDLVKTKNLEDQVIFLPYTINPYPYVKNAYGVTLTSRYEGFPRVLIEALALETPVISVNCSTGPSEIIKHKENGLLVKTYSAKAFAEALNEMMSNPELYSHCNQNARQSITQFHKSYIAEDWKNLLSLIL